MAVLEAEARQSSTKGVIVGGAVPEAEPVSAGGAWLISCVACCKCKLTCHSFRAALIGDCQNAAGQNAAQ